MTLRITPQDVKKRLEANESILLVDVRRHPNDQHIAGSVRIEPEDLLAADRVVLPGSHDRTIVAYCT